MAMSDNHGDIPNVKASTLSEPAPTEHQSTELATPELTPPHSPKHKADEVATETAGTPKLCASGTSEGPITSVTPGSKDIIETQEAPAETEDGHRSDMPASTTSTEGEEQGKPHGEGSVDGEGGTLNSTGPVLSEGAIVEPALVKTPPSLHDKDEEHEVSSLSSESQDSVPQMPTAPTSADVGVALSKVEQGPVPTGSLTSPASGTFHSGSGDALKDVTPPNEVTPTMISDCSGRAEANVTEVFVEADVPAPEQNGVQHEGATISPETPDKGLQGTSIAEGPKQETPLYRQAGRQGSKYSQHGSPATPLGTSVQTGNNGSRQNWPPRDSNQSYRSRGSPYNQQYNNGNGGRQLSNHNDEALRLHSQVVKLQQEMMEERKKNQGIRRTIEAEVKANMEQTMHDLILEVFRKQSDLAKIRLDMEEKEIRLQRRADRIQQQELFLSEGQKLLMSEHPEIRLRDATHINMQLLRDDVTSEVNSKIMEANARVKARIERVEIHEAEVEFLKKNWRLHAEEALRGEVEHEIMGHIAEAEYQRGFEHGKDMGRVEAMEAAHKEGYLEGYAAARKTHDTLMALRLGALPHDSPQLDFFYNPDHPENEYKRGVQIGYLRATQEARKATAKGNITPSHHSLVNGQPKQENRPSVNTDVNSSTNASTQVSPTNPTPYPARQTLYAQLHGPPKMHNEQIVFANGGAIKKDEGGAKDEAANTNGNANVRNGLYTPRDSQDSGCAAPNLIDL